MSAFMCNGATFDLLVSAAVARDVSLWITDDATISEDWQHDAPHYGGFRLHAKGNEQALYDCLFHANVRSVRTRYADADEAGMGTAAEPGIFRRVLPGSCMGTTPVAIAKSCDCLEYQSSESAGWEDSLAYRWITAIRDAQWSAVAGYDDAAWGAGESDIRPTRAQERAAYAKRKGA